MSQAPKEQRAEGESLFAQLNTNFVGKVFVAECGSMISVLNGAGEGMMLQLTAQCVIGLLACKQNLFTFLQI